ncbi:MAG TPA: helix-turn-helix domain-containing protein [Tepidiformaceae bacterium]|nr:helix-turn-helix domain-containing protein [Tepidiformaceae bacterium]
MSTKPQIPDFTAIPANLGWLGQMRTYSFELCEQLNYCPVTPDIEFVSFLRAFSRFGIFTFGPITIDVNVVEDILLRTHPKGAGGPDHQPISDEYLRFSETVWNTVNTSERPRVDELTYLRIFMQWSDGLPARVFGELGIRVEDIERYVSEISHPSDLARPAAERLYSTEEAAEYLGVHVQTVRAWIRSGKLPASRLAGQKSIRIRESDLQAVLEPIDPKQFDED